MSLYPDRPPFQTWTLDVGRGHRLHCDEWGSPQGQPACPHAHLRCLPQGGHDPAAPAMATAMVQALDHFATSGSFAAPR